MRYHESGFAKLELRVAAMLARALRMKCDSLECKDAAVLQLRGKAYCVRCANKLGMQPALVRAVLPAKPDYNAMKRAIESDPLVAAVAKAREGDIERAMSFIPKEPAGFRIEPREKSGIKLDMPEGWNRDTPNGPHDD